ncbi:MAG: hypothetical protein ABGX07_13795, partial [Pirellulaceae bacterium]
MVVFLADRLVCGQTGEPVTLNTKADGYRGIWYMNQPSNDEYVYKYSGGLGTYCAKHKPFAIYCEQRLAKRSSVLVARQATATADCFIWCRT